MTAPAQVSVGVAEEEAAAPTGFTTTALLDSDQLNVRWALHQGCRYVLSFPVVVDEFWTIDRCESEALEEFEDDLNRHGWRLRSVPVVDWAVDWTMITVTAQVGL